MGVLSKKIIKIDGNENRFTKKRLNKSVITMNNGKSRRLQKKFKIDDIKGILEKEKELKKWD